MKKNAGLGGGGRKVEKLDKEERKNNVVILRLEIDTNNRMKLTNAMKNFAEQCIHLQVCLQG